MSDQLLKQLQARVLNESGSPQTLSEVETTLSFSFTGYLREVLKKYEGPVVFDNGAKFKPNEKTPVDDELGYQSIEVLYGLSSGDNGILEKYKMYKDQIPDGFISIGEAPGGNQICIEIQSLKVFFWHHESIADSESLYEIASNFDEFFSRLEPDDSQVVEPKGVNESESFLDF